MAVGSFDPSTATPVNTGFNPATAQPVQPDYKTGLTLMDQYALNQADSLPEKRKYLTNVYGEKNVKTLPDGSLGVMKGGKLIAAAGGGVVKGATAQALADAPVLGGMATGAAYGARLGPWGVL